MSELKSCPFCGGEARLIESKVGGSAGVWAVYIKCPNCRAEMNGATGLYTDENFTEKMLSKWNRRAAPESEAGVADTNVGNKPLTLPGVPERDRQSMYDFLHDCFAEWVHDPAVGLYGMNDGEAALANAIMDALKPERSEE